MPYGAQILAPGKEITMNNIPPGATIAKVQMDRILESAVVLSWKDLLHPC